MLWWDLESLVTPARSTRWTTERWCAPSPSVIPPAMFTQGERDASRSGTSVTLEIKAPSHNSIAWWVKFEVVLIFFFLFVFFLFFFIGWLEESDTLCHLGEKAIVGFFRNPLLGHFNSTFIFNYRVLQCDSLNVCLQNNLIPVCHHSPQESVSPNINGLMGQKDSLLLTTVRKMGNCRQILKSLHWLPVWHERL